MVRQEDGYADERLSSGWCSLARPGGLRHAKPDDCSILTDLRQLLAGAEVTIAACVLSIVLASVIGITVFVARDSRWGPARRAAMIYVSAIRGTPLYIQIFAIYFLLPSVGLDLSRFSTGVLALGVNSGAFVSEMIRGAVSTMPVGQIEAARALAMSPRTIRRRIVLPQALRLILPPLTLEFTALIKNSAFLSIIGVVELTRTAQHIISVSYKPTQTWIVVAMIYFVFCFLLGLGARRVENLTSSHAAS
jgi:His/Glu/Gln/Arg/opine family amino acid ABC transporter permease subunit